MSGIVLGGTKKFSVEALVAIARQHEEVVLDQSALNVLTEDKRVKVPQPEDFVAASGKSNSSAQDGGGSNLLDVAYVRAVIATRIVSLLTGRLGVRSEVPIFLAAVLNAGIVPAITKSENETSAPLEQLVEFLACSPERAAELQCTSTQDGKTAKLSAWSDALNQANLTVPGLSAFEKKNVAHGFSGEVAELGLALDTCTALVNQADVVAALSCEVAAVWEKTFDPENYDTCRPHRYSKEVAGNMRLLLEGSTLLKKKSSQRSAFCFTYVPDMHATLRRAVAHAHPVVKVELNAAEAGSCGASTRDALSFHINPISSCSREVRDALLDNIHASRDRLAVLGPLAKLDAAAAAALATPEDSKTASDTLPQLVERCRRILAQEALLCFLVLGEQDDQALEAAKAVAAKKAAKAAKREAEMKAKFDAEVAAGKTPKPLKVAKVKPQKEPTGLVLGAGTRAVLNAFKANAVATVGEMQEFLVSRAARALFEDVLTQKDSVGRPTVAKGVRDAGPEQMTIREKCFGIIKDVFQRHGGVAIDTPVFELKSTLMGKYGEDTKLIYDLADQGGQQLALRYDLTVPFARFVASAGIKNIKRYHIAKVYRRDQPQMTKGRYREFHQCDFDICGEYPSMIADAEVLKVLCDVLTELNLGGFRVKLSHRLLLDALMAVSGVPDDLFRPICSAVDKLDKLPWEAVRKEMVRDKGLPEDVADCLGGYVTRDVSGMSNLEILESLRGDAKLSAHPSAQQAFTELETVFSFLDCFAVSDRVKFDLSLARGLDYYTGLIYEAVLTDTDQVGSIAAGGRYDNLIGMFSGVKIPAVGMSVGIERILSVLEDMERKRSVVRKNYTELFVASLGSNLLQARMRICNEMWTHKIKTEFLYHDNPKANRQLTYCLENAIPLILFVGEDEIKADTVNLKDLRTKVECIVARKDLPGKVKELLALSKDEIEALSKARTVEQPQTDSAADIKQT